jgi:S-DNA-T family DNA segregation ATPase FtsK/SpoIIIE
MASVGENAAFLPSSLAARLNAWLCGVAGYLVLAATVVAAASLVTWSIADPSLTHATSGPTRNLLGPVGAIFSDLVMQLLGLAGVFVILPPVFWALELIGNRRLEGARTKLVLAPVAVVLLACAASSLPKLAGWPLPYGLGGALGDFALRAVTTVLAMIRPERASAAAGLFCFAGGIALFITSLGLSQSDLKLIFKTPHTGALELVKRAWRRLGEMSEPQAMHSRREPALAATPPHFAMSPYRPAAAAAFDPAPRAYAEPRERQPAFEPAFEPGFDAAEADDIDPELERIAGICAPKSAVRPARSREDRVAPPAPPPRSARDEDPIVAARRVMVASTAPAREAAVIPPAAFPQHRRPAEHDIDQRQPAAMAPAEPEGWRPHQMPGGDPLYGRAVAIVLTDRKASTSYLERLLQIGYMRAADLIEQMERDGIVGAPVYNGIRPILLDGPGTDEV